MKVDQVILEQLDAALNGSGSSGSGKGNGEFAAVLDKAMSSETGGEGKKAVMPKNAEDQLMIDEKVPENGSMESADLEEKLELIMLALLKTDQEGSEKLITKPGQQAGQVIEEKIITILNSDKVDAKALKEELAAMVEQKAKNQGELKIKDEAIRNKMEAKVVDTKGEAKNEINMDAKKTFVENEALPKEKEKKALNTEKTGNYEKAADKQAASKKAFSGDSADKQAASKKAFSGDSADKEAELKGKTSELDVSRSENAEKKAEKAAGKKVSKEADNIKTTAEQKADKKIEQKLEVNAEQKASPKTNTRQDSALNQARNENNRADTNMQKPQNVSPEQEQNIAQQSTIKGDEALQGNRVLNAQNANLRESVMQQLQGRMTYLRESGNNPAEMRVTLHPPELGEVTVRVFSSKGRLSASIIAETPLAREILESSITELRQRMNFVNIQFDQLDVSTAGKEHEGFDRPGDREGSGKAEFGEAEGDEKRSAESEPPPQQMPPDDSGSGIDFWA